MSASQQQRKAVVVFGTARARAEWLKRRGLTTDHQWRIIDAQGDETSLVVIGGPAELFRIVGLRIDAYTVDESVASASRDTGLVEEIERMLAGARATRP